jgi:hypothetical protein
MWQGQTLGHTHPHRMRRRFRILCAVALIGCNDSSGLTDLGPVPDGTFTTDATGYVAVRIEGAGSLSRYRFRVVTRFENRTAASLFLGRCFPDTREPLFSVVRAYASDPESGYQQIWACVGHDRQFEVRPGEVRTDTLRVEGPNTFDGITQKPLGVTEGRFRLYYDVRSARGDGAPPVAELRLSNEFVVRTER